MAELGNAPNVIGRYELLTRLATGGMAELFLARERGLAGLERLVVVKRILPHLADEPSFVEMFLREARIVARLSHPNVVQIYELGQEAESYHIAMEYIHGSTIRELLVLAQKSDAQMPCDVAVAVAEQACRGLEAAHELKDLDGKPLGLVHRDVSPHNLMCTTDGHIKLLDFGVAKSTSASVEATYSGNLKGKFAYLSPEQCRHEPLDRRSDVFAIGIVMWEMLTMRRLFKRKTELQMMQAIIGGDIPPPGRFREDVPQALEDVVLRALATERDDRFQTAEEMRQALVAAANTGGLELDEKRVAAFLNDIAGGRLAERQATVESACERELTVAERRRLLHMTGTSSRAEAGSQTGSGPTIVETPTGTDKTQQAAADRIQELVEADRKEVTGTSDTSERTAVERPDTHSGGDEGTDGQASSPAPDPSLEKSITETKLSQSDQAQGPLSGNRLPVLFGAALVTIVVGLGLFLSTGILEFGSSSEEEELVDMIGDVSVSGEPITLGWAPTIDREVLEQEVAPLHRYLERETGRPVPMVVADDYTELSRMLRRGEVTAAIFPPTLYVLTSEQDRDVEFMAMREFDGTASSDGHLLVRRGEGISELEDLEGARFCFVDQASTSGRLLPRHHIRREGYEPDEFVGSVHWSGDHFQSMRDLIDGECDAAAVYSGAYLSADEYDIPSARVSTLAQTGQLPQDVVAVGEHTEQGDRDVLIDALLDFDPQQEFEVPRLGQNQRITGFLEQDEEQFDHLRSVVRQEGIEIEDL